MMKDLTQGNIHKSITLFALPMMAGNFFSQLYNVVDSAVVGKFIGTGALGAVGSAFSLMNFLTSILLGLCMGSSVMFSMYFGAKKQEELKHSITTSFYFIALFSIVLCIGSLLLVDEILIFLNIPKELMAMSKEYIVVIFMGILFIFLYQWSAALLRSLGNSKTPLYALIIACVLNIILDIIFVVWIPLGVKGAAYATLVAQGISALITVVALIPLWEKLSFHKCDLYFDLYRFKEIFSYSMLTSIQQSIMNFGILMIQGLVNSYGTAVMAAFSAAVKIDAFAYMPLQDYGNAFSTFIAQNKGAGKLQRIKEGIRFSIVGISVFSVIISIVVILFKEPLLKIFIEEGNTEVVKIGMNYLCIEGSFYILIGYLFLLYGLYRGLGKVSMSIVLSVVSLGLRVLLSYLLHSLFGLSMIWWAIVIGWFCADVLGFVWYIYQRKLES